MTSMTQLPSNAVSELVAAVASQTLRHADIANAIVAVNPTLADLAAELIGVHHSVFRFWTAVGVRDPCALSLAFDMLQRQITMSQERSRLRQQRSSSDEEDEARYER